MYSVFLKLTILGLSCDRVKANFQSTEKNPIYKPVNKLKALKILYSSSFKKTRWYTFVAFVAFKHEFLAHNRQFWHTSDSLLLYIRVRLHAHVT